MGNTLAIHYVRSAYGLWLPGEERGHWSEAWDDEIGYVEPHTLHAGDPVRLRMAQERMKHTPVRWDARMQAAITNTMARCAAESPWKVLGYCIEETHFHAMLTPSPLDIDRTVKWVGHQMTKAVRAVTGTDTPIFCKGRWLQFIFEQSHYDNLDGYIARHNQRLGLPARPYPFIVANPRG